MQRLLVPALVAVLVLTVVDAASPAATSSTRGRASAEHQAQRLLRAYVPPKGAVLLKAVPKGEHLPGTGFGGIFGERVLRHRIWLVHLPVKTFMRYFFHRIHGWHAIAYGTLRGRSYRSVISTSVTFAETGFGGRATGRVLSLVAGKSHRAGWSLLRADILLVWRLSAAELEYLPAGVREIEIRGPHAKARITNRDQVGTIVRWFDQFQIKESPFFGGSCGVAGGNPSVTFVFQGRHGTVARAIVPRNSGGCASATYTIRGRAQTPLIAGDVDRRVQKLLGVRLFH